MIDKFYDQVVVKTVYKGNCGSGVLLQTENKNYSYLVTAWHCVNQEETVDLGSLTIYRQVNGSLQLLTATLQDILVISQNDLVVIKLDYLSDIPLYRTIAVSVGDIVSITGFPRAMENPQSRIKRYPLDAKIISLPGEGIIEINSERSMSTFSQNAKEIMSSFSGSGIFKIVENEIFLCGIITDLSSPEGAFDAISGVSRDCIQQKLAEKSWELLCDIEGCSFNLFKEGVIEIFEEPMNRICSVQIPIIRDNVTPNDILKRCGKKLVWPYSNANLQCKEIWEGWLLYLIFRCMEDQENLKSENYYIVNDENGVRKVKLIYVTNKTKLSDFLKDYLQNAYRDIHEGDFLIIKTNKQPATKILPSSQIDKIVTDISNVICVEREIRIDDVKSNVKRISLMHIRKLIDELEIVIEANVDEGMDSIELERRLGKRIGEMLHEF
ncbi:ABC-three component system protein [Ruminiclostridium cellulolyticum]|uniref:ABC-three component systems C-terminal domain-containing protein n=1 Tax=Ruminiclostridium cellulolyticum (strain ATCC 35319 / DSM 5812 / JCM 6584 / H10) TaxID=394503 RepID=B8I7F1_RUMCH|nr:ABC-three component system protein [Ruminiclostridium cellulolyticum]ACL77022.1 hypothetical protein Ccel_2711 [Ruminiclostridium cellulolyticum H10]